MGEWRVGVWIRSIIPTHKVLEHGEKYLTVNIIKETSRLAISSVSQMMKRCRQLDSQRSRHDPIRVLRPRRRPRTDPKKEHVPFSVCNTFLTTSHRAKPLDRTYRKIVP